MPMQTWRCATCKKEMDVLRKFDEFDVPPTVDEGGVCDHDERHGAVPHAWTKIIHPPRVARAPGWGPGKGHWILAALAVGLSALLGGCSVSTGDIEKAQKLCGPNNGVERIFPQWPFPTQIKCKNGALFE